MLKTGKEREQRDIKRNKEKIDDSPPTQLGTNETENLEHDTHYLSSHPLLFPFSHPRIQHEMILHVYLSEGLEVLVLR